MKIQERKNIGESGYADVRVLKNSIRLVFDESGEGYELELDQWEDKRPGGKYNVTLNGQGTKIIGVRPIAGAYVVQFSGFGNRVNEVPEPKVWRGGVRHKKDGSTWYQADRLMFTLNYKVQSPGNKYDGLTINDFLPYCFERFQGSDLTQLTGRRGDISKAEKVLGVCGFDFMRIEIPYSSNVLPWLESHLLEIGAVFMTTIGDKGFVDSVSELPEELRGKAKK